MLVATCQSFQPTSLLHLLYRELSCLPCKRTANVSSIIQSTLMLDKFRGDQCKTKNCREVIVESLFYFFWRKSAELENWEEDV